MELLSRDRTICGGLFAAQRVRNRRLSKPNTVVIRRAGYGALARLDRVRGVRFLRLTCRAADGPAQPEMTQSRSRARNVSMMKFQTLSDTAIVRRSPDQKGVSHRRLKVTGLGQDCRIFVSVDLGRRNSRWSRCCRGSILSARSFSH
jgi:hypothetical protein